MMIRLYIEVVTTKFVCQPHKVRVLYQYDAISYPLIKNCVSLPILTQLSTLVIFTHK
jgi:hypothetical protein